MTTVISHIKTGIAIPAPMKAMKYRKLRSMRGRSLSCLKILIVVLLNLEVLGCSFRVELL